MTLDEHIQTHKDLHKALDELVADFITHTDNLPSKTTLMDFMNWSGKQAINPTNGKIEKHKKD